MIEPLLFLISSFLAGAVATIAGFGSSTLLIPVALFFMDVKAAIFLVACFHLFSNFFKVKAFKQKIDWRIFLLFGVASIIFSYTGARLVFYIPVDIIKKTLAGFLIIFSAYSLWKPKFKIKANKTNAVTGGGLSGLLAGLIGLGGAIRSAFLIAFNLPKKEYIATSAMIALVIDLVRVPTYLAGGLAKGDYYILIPFLIITAYFGVKAGKLLIDKINQVIFKRIVLGALVLVGLKLFFI